MLIALRRRGVLFRAGIPEDVLHHLHHASKKLVMASSNVCAFPLRSCFYYAGREVVEGSDRSRVSATRVGSDLGDRLRPNPNGRQLQTAQWLSRDLSIR